MDYIKPIVDFSPANEQEVQDKKVILDYIEKFPHNILLRENEFAHITSSAFIMNQSFDKALMIHHNIRNAWAWTGGHVDGDSDLLHIAIKESKEETGIKTLTALTKEIVSLDILPVVGHMRRNKYVSAHLHLSVAYILIADEKEEINPRICIVSHGGMINMLFRSFVMLPVNAEIGISTGDTGIHLWKIQGDERRIIFSNKQEHLLELND